MDQGAAQHQWGLGFRTFTYEAIALKDGEFTSDDAFVVDLVWYPRPAEPQRAAEPQRDRLRLPYLGGANGTSMIRRVSDSTTDAGVFYEVVPAQEDGRAGRSAVPSNMIKVTFAEDVESLPELEKLSREELIDLLMKTQGARREYPTSNSLGQDPIIVYYKKPSDKIDIENIEARGARATNSEEQARSCSDQRAMVRRRCAG